jgi:hypothetical protein
MHLTGYSGLPPPLSADDTDRGNKGVGNLFVTVRAKNLRGLSGFLDTRFEQPPATIQNVPISTPQESLTLIVKRLDHL